MFWVQLYPSVNRLAAKRRSPEKTFQAAGHFYLYLFIYLVFILFFIFFYFFIIIIIIIIIIYIIIIIISGWYSLFWRL